MSAIIAICAIFAFGLLGAGMAWSMLEGKVGVGSVTWWTALNAAGLVYLAIVVRDKPFRVAILTLRLVPSLEQPYG